MPWNVKWLNSYSSHNSQSQKQCKKSSFAFYQAVRDLVPVWLLEDIRTMEAFHWEEGGKELQFSMKQQLLDNPQHWEDLLGENRFQWLAGLAPTSLFITAMRVLIRSISPEQFPEALENLPLPQFLKPLDLKLKS
ncbi:unnamed protein product [Caretta caretta]